MPSDHDSPPRRLTQRLRGWLINIVLILVVFSGVQWWKARPLASGEAPPLAGVTLDGRALDLTDFRGQPLLVHFWATWCPICRVMDGAIAALAADHAVVTVALQSGTDEETRVWLRESGHDFPVIPDPEGQLAHQWGVNGVPTTFIVDAAGRIRHASVGVGTEPGLRLRLWIATLGN